jgi:hypothetical protein
LGISIGISKAKSVEQFLAHSTSKFWQLIRCHLNEYEFHNSAWSERCWSVKHIWIGSTIDTDMATITMPRIGANEDSVDVDWRLPLSQLAHEALANRINMDFKRATAMIFNPEKRKSAQGSHKPEKHSTECGLLAAVGPWGITK